MIRNLHPRFIATPGQPTSYGGPTILLTPVPGEFVPRIPRNWNVINPRPIIKPREAMSDFGLERE